MPDVRPNISGHPPGHELDFTGYTHRGVFLSNGEDAVLIFEQTTDREWQCCTLFANTCRGKRAVETGRAMRDWMMPAHADMIFGSIRPELRAAQWFYAQMGGERRDTVTLSNGDTYHANPGEVFFVLEGKR